MADDGGLSRIQRRLNAIPRYVKDRMAAVTVEEAGKVADDMRAMALASKDTGAMIESIVVTPGGQATPPYSQPGGSASAPEGGAMITAGNAEVRYPHLVEYGHKGPNGTIVEPQPFFWPAVRLNNKPVRARLRREAKKVIADNWGKK